MFTKEANFVHKISDFSGKRKKAAPGGGFFRGFGPQSMISIRRPQHMGMTSPALMNWVRLQIKQ